MLTTSLFLATLIVQAPEGGQTDRDGYDPLAAARDARVTKLEAAIPPPCYTITAGVSNPCWVCHTAGTVPNFQDDTDLQREYAFSPAGLRNGWTGLFEDRRARAADIPDNEILDWIRSENTSGLREALEQAPEYVGYVPDLDLEAGFDELGFARDGSAWRAVRYKPFPGMFWPTNGSAGDVFVRLPVEFRTRDGEFDPLVYRANLSLLEAAVAVDPRRPNDRVEHAIEPLDEEALGVDLDGDGELAGEATTLRALPDSYFGDAQSIPLVRYLLPQGTEFLHTVRYVDLEAPGFLSRRLKELRYMRKELDPDLPGLLAMAENEVEERQRGKTPIYRGAPMIGFHNDSGWRLQGFIEDIDGRLRLQTADEHRYCMGCHGTLGVTVDQTFSLARKVPGIAGWRPQDLTGMRDTPQIGHTTPEVLTYLERVRGGDELRANQEMLARLFDTEGEVRRELVLEAGPDGPRDLAWLLAPSQRRALDMAKVYRIIVADQAYARGRDPLLFPAENVHQVIEDTDAGLVAAQNVFSDGRLQLDWGSHRD